MPGPGPALAWRFSSFHGRRQEKAATTEARAVTIGTVSSVTAHFPIHARHRRIAQGASRTDIFPAGEMCGRKAVGRGQPAVTRRYSGTQAVGHAEGSRVTRRSSEWTIPANGQSALRSALLCLLPAAWSHLHPAPLGGIGALAVQRSTRTGAIAARRDAVLPARGAWQRPTSPAIAWSRGLSGFATAAAAEER